jgi:hypothetical protein
MHAVLALQGVISCPPLTPRLHSTDLVELHPYWTIMFYKLCDFWKKYFILSQVALLVCIARFWAKQPHDTYMLKPLGIFNQTRHFQNQRISVSAIRVENTAYQNPSTELLSFSFSSCNIQISYYSVCVCVCVCACVCVYYFLLLSH